MIHYHTYGPDEKIPEGVIIPQQVHSTKIVEIITGEEDLTGVDGVWTRNPPRSPLASKGGSEPAIVGDQGGSFKLGIKTADCAPIVFWNEEIYGVVHAGWRGLVDGIIEEMLSLAPDLNTYVGPFYHTFEIQKDDCYEQIVKKFGDQFFTPLQKGSALAGSRGVLFDFQKAIQSILPQAQFNPRSTFESPELASWRRDQNARRNVTMVTIV